MKVDPYDLQLEMSLILSSTSVHLDFGPTISTYEKVLLVKILENPPPSH